MLFNQIVLPTCSSESIGSSVVRKQITFDRRELAGNGLQQDVAVDKFSQMEYSRNILCERIKQKPPGGSRDTEWEEAVVKLIFWKCVQVKSLHPSPSFLEGQDPMVGTYSLPFISWLHERHGTHRILVLLCPQFSESGPFMLNTHIIQSSNEHSSSVPSTVLSYLHGFSHLILRTTA